MKARLLDNKHPRKYALDQTVFDELNEESCYWLGFLAADGNIHKDLYSFRLEIGKRDRPHLEKFSKFLKTDKPITQGKTCCGVTINSTYMVSRLLELGLYPNKSLTLKPYDGIPKQHITSSLGESPRL